MGQIFKLPVNARALAAERLISPAFIAEKILDECRFVNYRLLCRVLPDAGHASFVQIETLPKLKKTMEFVDLHDNAYMFCYPAQVQYFCGDRFETDFKNKNLFVLYEPFANYLYLLDLALVELKQIVDFAAGKMFAKPQVVTFNLNIDGKQAQKSFDVTLNGLEQVQL